MLFAFLLYNRNIGADIYTLQDGCRLFIKSFILFSSLYISSSFLEGGSKCSMILPVSSAAKELNNKRNFSFLLPEKKTNFHFCFC